jgi:ribulose 1,5-bisphosphate carboxylase large subunit-like protein
MTSEGQLVARPGKRSLFTLINSETSMDQSNRYADLSLREEDLIKGGKHILVAYKMKPKAGYDYLQAAAHFAAESSTGTNVEVCTTDDFTRVASTRWSI